MKTKRYLILAFCLFILGTFISACGGGGKTTSPPSYPFIPTPTPTPAKYPIELSQTEFTVNVGETDNIIVTLNGEDITQNATYTVDQEAIATVEGGLITGISAGIATVTVNAENAESEKTFTVNVIDPTLPTLEVSPTEINLFIEEEAKVEVTLNGEDVTEQVAYTSDSELIAIAEKGVVKAKYIEGTAKITVSLEGANSAIFTVNVTDDSTPVTLNKDVLNQLYDLEIIANSYADIQQLTEIDIPATFTYKGTKYKITSIGYNLFFNCTSLKKVTLPDSLETITQKVFNNCSSLEEMTIRDDVVCIFPSAFLNCSNLTKLTTKSGKEINIPTNDVETVDNVTFIGVKLEPDPHGSGYTTITNVNIPNGLTEIPNMAFNICTSFAELIIPDSVINIGDMAFNCCTFLENVNIGKRVTTIGYESFYNCSSIKSVTIPDNVITIGKGAFMYCSLLESVNIGKNVTTIGQEAFENCIALKSVTIPDSVITIEQQAFKYCSLLKSVTIGKNVTTIKWGAFDNCTNSGLTIDISKSNVTSIGDNAFYNVNNIKINEEQNLLDDGRHWGAKNVTIVNSQNN